ncbi:MAG: glycosyltransferase [Rubrivivax sp.]
MWHALAARVRAWWAARRAPPAPPFEAAGPAVQPAGAAPDLRGCTSVIIPALNEAARIAEVVRHALADEATAEVIVVDDSSIDDTVALARSAGARVVTSTMLGKGASMRDGLDIADHRFVAYLDGDLTGLRPGLIGDLVRPLVRDEADFVKARFGRGGGRVTELTAKPMLKVFFPELAHLAQPLGGIVAARRGLLRQLDFEDGYGVDVGLVIDAVCRGARLAEVDIGRIDHDSQPLHDLAAMANEVARVIYARSRAAGRLHVEQISAMYEAQRQATASIEYIQGRRRGRDRLLLLDMDGTVTPARFIVELARRTGHEEALQALLDRDDDDAVARSLRIAALFRFVHRRQFEQVARGLPLRRGIVAWVNRMRRAGFMVGIVSDSYYVAAEVLRRRVFADFALAHTMQFRDEVCTGELRLNPAFAATGDAAVTAPCKSHVLRHLRADPGQPEWTPFDTTWAVGDSLNDLELLRAADRAFVVEPKSPRLRHVPGVIEIADFEELAVLVEREGWLEPAGAQGGVPGHAPSSGEPAGAATVPGRRPPWPHAA